MAAAGVVFWGAVVGSVGAEVLGRVLGRRRRGEKGGEDDDEDDDDAEEEHDGRGGSASASASASATPSSSPLAAAAAADGDEGEPAASPPAPSSAAAGEVSPPKEEKQPSQPPQQRRCRGRWLRRAACAALAAAAVVAAARTPLLGPLLPEWVPRDWREAADLLLCPLPASLGGRKAGRRGKRRQNASSSKSRPPPLSLSPGVPPGAPPAPLAAGTLPGHAPLVEVVRFKERQWYLEELDDSRDGDANAMVRLARMRLHGQGCPPSVSAAQEWVSRARALGAAASLEELVATDSADPRAALGRMAREEEGRRRALGEKIGRAIEERAAEGGGCGGGGGGGGEGRRRPG